MLNAMVSRTSGGSWSQGPWKEEIYRQCLLESQCIGLRVCPQAMSYYAAYGTRDDYLFRHIIGLGVDGSVAVGCGGIAGEVNFLARAVCSAGLECLLCLLCPLCPSSVPTSATEALVAFFRAICDLSFFNWKKSTFGDSTPIIL